MILVQNSSWLTIIWKLGSENQHNQSYWPWKFFEILIKHHKEIRVEHQHHLLVMLKTMCNVSDVLTAIFVQCRPSSHVLSLMKPGYQLQWRWVWVARDGQSDETSKKVVSVDFQAWGFILLLIRMKFYIRIITQQKLGVQKPSSTHRLPFITTNFPLRIF